MENKNEDVEVEEALELPEVKEGEEDTTDYKAEALKLRDKAIAQRERTKALKKERDDAKTALEAITKSKEPKKESSKTGELDETQLDYLDVKGISDPDDIKVIEDIVKKTGMTVRQALKDEYVVAKLESNQKSREVKDATPSKNNRGGNSVNDVESAIAKFDATGEFPKDFALKTKVVNAITDRSNGNKPSWHR